MAAAADELMLRLVRVFDAPRERVFAAWTDPEQFGAWFGPPGVTTAYCNLDLRPGGAWRLLGRNDERSFALSGKYLEVSPPERLRFTWAWHQDGDHARPREHESIVTIEFRALGDKTEMTLVHGPFADTVGVTNHNRGWTGTLSKLEAFLRRAS